MLFPRSDVNHPAAGFELTAICILENLPSFRLDPSPPIAPIVERTTDGFIVESVQLLATAALAKAASQSMSKLQYLALQLAKQGQKRSLPWTHSAVLSPWATAVRCSTKSNGSLANADIAERIDGKALRLLRINGAMVVMRVCVVCTRIRSARKLTSLAI